MQNLTESTPLCLVKLKRNDAMVTHTSSLTNNAQIKLVVITQTDRSATFFQKQNTQAISNGEVFFFHEHMHNIIKYH